MGNHVTHASVNCLRFQRLGAQEAYIGNRFHRREEIVMSQTTITGIGTVGIPVSDQDKALEFFTGTLGFEKRLDMRMGESFRWVTVAAPSAATSVALITGPPTGADTGIRFLVPDAETEHATLRQRGVPVGDLLRWPGVPPML